jgi:hypothetical protein
MRRLGLPPGFRHTLRPVNAALRRRHWSRRQDRTLAAVLAGDAARRPASAVAAHAWATVHRAWYRRWLTAALCLTAVALVWLFAWVLVVPEVRRLTAAPPPVVTETFSLACLSPEQAASIIRPYLPAPENPGGRPSASTSSPPGWHPRDHGPGPARGHRSCSRGALALRARRGRSVPGTPRSDHEAVNAAWSRALLVGASTGHSLAPFPEEHGHATARDPCSPLHPIPGSGPRGLQRRAGGLTRVFRGRRA